MDLFEKINRSFGSWYEGLFGGGDDVRPKDILRRILSAMEDHRKEGFDNRVYVPNQYVLEVNVQDVEEKEYLLSFLDRDELEAAIRRYCQQNHYHIRGPLDFTIKEVDESEVDAGQRGEKVRVLCRYNTKVTGPDQAPALPAAAPAPRSSASVRAGLPEIPIEERTVAGFDLPDYEEDDAGTVPSIATAALAIYAPDRAPFRYTIARQAVNIGRSPKAGNELVIETDGQISKRHARIEMEADGRFTIYDLGSTNGTKVNGRRVDNRPLNDGDEITLGATKLTFQQAERSVNNKDDNWWNSAAEGRATSPPVGRNGGAFGGAAAAFPAPAPERKPPVGRGSSARPGRLVLMDGAAQVDDFLLASETTIGRGVTNDIVLPDRSIGTRHAVLVNEGDGYTLESFEAQGTTLNGAPVAPNRPVPLKDGDKIGLGNLFLRFEATA